MKPAPTHHARVFGSPWAGVYGTHIESARHFGKHWHAVYGLGLLADGAQSSASGRGAVQAYAGDLISTNPGEVHDGQPLGGPSRRWRMVYLDPGVLASMVGDPAATGAVAPELTRPVIQDARLGQALVRLLDQLEHRHAGPAWSSADALAGEESLVHTCALLKPRVCMGFEACSRARYMWHMWLKGLSVIDVLTEIDTKDRLSYSAAKGEDRECVHYTEGRRGGRFLVLAARGVGSGHSALWFLW